MKKLLSLILLLALSLTTLPALAEDPIPVTDFTWTSSDPTVAIVNENDEIVAVGLGTAVITITYGEESTEITVNVASLTCPDCGLQITSAVSPTHTCTHVEGGTDYGCGAQFDCGETDEHALCSACGNPRCYTAGGTHSTPCGYYYHRACVMEGYRASEHKNCDICGGCLSIGSHGVGYGKCGASLITTAPTSTPKPIPTCSGCGAPNVQHTERCPMCGGLACSGNHDGLPCDHCPQQSGNHSQCSTCGNFFCHDEGAHVCPTYGTDA